MLRQSPGDPWSGRARTGGPRIQCRAPALRVAPPAGLLIGLLIALLLWGGLCLAGEPAGLAPAAPGPALSGAGPFAGYELVEVSYLLRAPDGALVRVTRTPAGPAAWDAAPGAETAPGAPGAPRAERAQWLSGWLSALLFRSPHLYAQVSDYVRESWATLLRLLDYLGVIVLFAGAYVIWFLVRPALLGVSDRIAFLLAFVLAGGLWLYVTGLYLSVVYALGLMLLPAAVLGLGSWLLRRLWRAWRGPAPQAGAP
jgi:hypothetical protein